MEGGKAGGDVKEEEGRGTINSEGRRKNEEGKGREK